MPRQAPSCTRSNAAIFCMSLRTASLHTQKRLCLLHVIASNVLAPAHTSFLLHVIANQCAHWCGNPHPRRGRKGLAALWANSLRLTYLPKVLFSTLCYCKENGLSRRFAPRNDRGGCMSLRTTSLQPRTRPSFCMSLRTSAHTGVAIRVPAEMPSKLAAVRANSLRLTYLPKVLFSVL